MRKRLNKWIKGLLFTKTLKTITKKKKLCLFIFMFDALMLISLSLVNSVIKMISPNDPQAFASMFSSASGVILFVLFYTIAYFAIILLVYSLIKYCILDLIKSMFRKHRFSLSRFWRFYWLNIRIIGLPFAAVIMLTMVSAIAIQRQYAAPFIAIMMLPVLFFYYPFFNICQSYFYKGKASPVKSSFRITFTGIRKYRCIYLSSIMALAAYYLITLIITVILKFTLFRTQEMYDAYYPGFFAVYQVITIVAIYLLMSFNRIMFYQVED